MTDPDLDAYHRKRRFAETPEPAGGAARTRAEGAGSPAQLAGDRFVIHEHHARRLHWDLRLERDGVLVSWAVPNGIPTHPEHNRKAVHVEDHPLDYISFAGTIPAGNYGAGEVTIWDAGTYRVEKWEPGKVIVDFTGRQLRGRYALFRAGAQERDWMIHRIDPPIDPEAVPMPDFLAPMTAAPGELPSPNDSDGWGFEIAWDGLRTLVHSEPGRLTLRDAQGADVTAAFPELRVINRALSSHAVLLDGEIVVLDRSGRPDADVLARRTDAPSDSAQRRLAASTPVTLVLSDLLWRDGHSWLERSYAERRTALEALGLSGPHWQTPAYHHGDGAELLAGAGALGLGAILAKSLDAPYRPGEAGWRRIATA